MEHPVLYSTLVKDSLKISEEQQEAESPQASNKRGLEEG